MNASSVGALDRASAYKYFFRGLYIGLRVEVKESELISHLAEPKCILKYCVAVMTFANQNAQQVVPLVTLNLFAVVFPRILSSIESCITNYFRLLFNAHLSEMAFKTRNCHRLSGSGTLHVNHDGISSSRVLFEPSAHQVFFIA